MSRGPRQAGFTLIELLAAMAIFAVLALMTQQALMAALSTERRLSVRRSELAELQRAVTVLGRDLEKRRATHGAWLGRRAAPRACHRERGRGAGLHAWRAAQPGRPAAERVSAGALRVQQKHRRYREEGVAAGRPGAASETPRGDAARWRRAGTIPCLDARERMAEHMAGPRESDHPDPASRGNRGGIADPPLRPHPPRGEPEMTRPPSPRFRHSGAGLVRQSGMALLNALVIVSVVAGVAARMLRDDVDARSRFEMMIRSDQARQYALAAEWLARDLLETDWEEDGTIDHLAETWAQSEHVLPIETGQVRSRIFDLQGLFNLNAIGDSNGELHQAAYDQLDRLLDAAGAPPKTAVAVAEWILSEPPDMRGTRGDRPYLTADPPYQRARAPMTGGSELALIAGMEADAYRQLRPLVTALPIPTTINVNTAPAPVLMSLAPGIDDGDVDEIIEIRTETPFASAAEFRQQMAERIRFSAAGALEEAPVTVVSSWFLIDVEAQAGSGRSRVFTVVQRSAEDGAVSVLMRLEERP